MDMRDATPLADQLLNLGPAPQLARHILATDDEDRARRLAPCHCEDGCDGRDRCTTCDGHAYLTCVVCAEPATAGIVRLGWSEEQRCERCNADAKEAA